MQNDLQTEQVITILHPDVSVLKRSLLSRNNEIRNARKYLIIELSTSLAYSITWLFNTIVFTLVIGSRILWACALASFLSILLHGVGIFVAYRYSPTGLRVFAWMNTAEKGLMGTWIRLFIFDLISAFTAVKYADLEENKNPPIGTTTNVIVSCIIFAIQLMQWILQFKNARNLARLIDAQKNVIVQ